MALELHTITEFKLTNAISEMLKPEYKENVKKLRELVYDQPMTGRERAVWWTEYVIRHKGTKHLQYAGISVPFYQTYWLDFIGIAFVMITIVIISIKKFVRCFGSSHKTKKE